MTGALAVPLPGGGQLRALDEADADELHALIERNRAQLAKWMQWAQDQTLEQTLAFIRRSAVEESNNRGLQRAIVTHRHIVGMVGFPGIDWANRCAEIGYWLDRAHQGRGVMTAAVAALAEHALDGLHLNRVEIHTDVENAPSRAVAERLGFRYEGTLRQSYRITDERYSDDAVYSLLRSDPREAVRVAATLMR